MASIRNGSGERIFGTGPFAHVAIVHRIPAEGGGTSDGRGGFLPCQRMGLIRRVVMFA